MGSDAIHEAFEAFWESGGPWPPLALSVIIGVVTMTMGLMLVYHGTKMSSSPLILCSVTGLLIGLALTVVLPQVRAGSPVPHSAIAPSALTSTLAATTLTSAALASTVTSSSLASAAVYPAPMPCTGARSVCAARFSAGGARVDARRRWRD